MAELRRRGDQQVQRAQPMRCRNLDGTVTVATLLAVDCQLTSTPSFAAAIAGRPQRPVDDAG